MYAPKHKTKLTPTWIRSPRFSTRNAKQIAATQLNTITKALCKCNSISAFETHAVNTVVFAKHIFLFQLPMSSRSEPLKLY